MGHGDENFPPEESVEMETCQCSNISSDALLTETWLQFFSLISVAVISAGHGFAGFHRRRFRQREQARRSPVQIALGLDQPLWIQYKVFLFNLLKGDLRVSYIFKRPALTLIIERMPATLELVFLSVLISVAVALPCGVFAGAGPTTLSAGPSWEAPSWGSPCPPSGSASS